MLLKTLRVPQEAVLRTECQFRTVGGRFRYRMHIPCTPNPLYRVRWKTLCISLQKLRLDISGDNTGNSQLYPQGVGGSENVWYKDKNAPEWTLRHLGGAEGARTLDLRRDRPAF